MFICRNDIETSFNLEIRIISPSMRGPWFGFNKVVDSDTTNFNDLVDEIVDKIPSGYGDVLIQFYLFTISIGLLISLLYQGVCNRFKSARSFGDYISFWAK